MFVLKPGKKINVRTIVSLTKKSYSIIEVAKLFGHKITYLKEKAKDLPQLLQICHLIIR